MDSSTNDDKKVQEVMTPPSDESPEATAAVKRLILVENFNLQGVQSKIDYIQEIKVRNPALASGWVIFLNKAHNLAHIMHMDDTEYGDYSRMRQLPSHLKGAAPEYIRRWFYNRMVARYII